MRATISFPSKQPWAWSIGPQAVTCRPCACHCSSLATSDQGTSVTSSSLRELLTGCALQPAGGAWHGCCARGWPVLAGQGSLGDRPQVRRRGRAASQDAGECQPLSTTPVWNQHALNLAVSMVRQRASSSCTAQMASAPVLWRDARQCCAVTDWCSTGMCAERVASAGKLSGTCGSTLTQRQHRPDSC